MDYEYKYYTEAPSGGKKKSRNGRFVAFGAVIVVICLIVSSIAGGASAFLVMSLYPKFKPTEVSNPVQENIFTPANAPSSEAGSDGNEIADENGIADSEILQTPEADSQEPSQSSLPLSEPETAAPTPVSGVSSGGQQAKTKGQIYADNVGSVVTIKAKTSETYLTLFGRYATQEYTSTGTGFIVTDDGYIVTNYHVIEGSDNITVSTYDGYEFIADIRGYEASNDIAVLKIEGEFTPVVFGSSAELSVGDDILVIGNAVGELTYTFTDGVVSYLSRRVTTESGTAINMFQTNAAINEGNSGGPVYNMQGEVVGIASAKYAASSVEGLGFCIPVDDVSGIITDIIAFGYVTGKPCLGISVQTISTAMSIRYSLPVGCYVVDMDNNSCSARAGIQNEDVITAVDGIAVSSTDDLAAVMAAKKAGSTVTITVSRNYEKLDYELTLDEYIPAEARTSYSNVFDF